MGLAEQHLMAAQVGGQAVDQLEQGVIQIGLGQHGGLQVEQEAGMVQALVVAGMALAAQQLGQPAGAPVQLGQRVGQRRVVSGPQVQQHHAGQARCAGAVQADRVGHLQAAVGLGPTHTLGTVERGLGRIRQISRIERRRKHRHRHKGLVVAAHQHQAGQRARAQAPRQQLQPGAAQLAGVARLAQRSPGVGLGDHRQGLTSAARGAIRTH